MPESRWSHAARMALGTLLVLESLALFVVGSVVVVIGGLAGALAFVAGAGGATDTQIAQGFAAIVFTIASPIVLAAALGLAGFFLVMRMGRGAIIAAGVLALAAQVAFHLLVEKSVHPAEIILIIVHLSTIVVGFGSVPARVATVTRSANVPQFQQADPSRR